MADLKGLFDSFWRWFGPTPAAPKWSVDEKNVLRGNYDPKLGPDITPEEVSGQLLTLPFSADLLKCLKDPADFMNRRAAIFRTPTPAVVVSSGTKERVPLRADQLSARLQAVTLLGRLSWVSRELGGFVVGTADQVISEEKLDGARFAIDWNGETRRKYVLNVGNAQLNAGLLGARYAMLPVEVADPLTRSEVLTAP